MTDLRYATVTRPTSQLEDDRADAYVPECRTWHDSRPTVDPWYPVEGAQSPDKTKRDAAYAYARTICQACPVRVACLDAAMDIEGHREPGSRHGMWGGLDPFERHLLARRIGRKTLGLRLKPIDHGTRAGYRMHYRRNIPVCDMCAQAEAVYYAASGRKKQKP